MKQKILDALKLKFEGVSETILNRIADKMAKTVTAEDAVQGAVDAVTFQQVIDAEADRRATEATQTAVTHYEKKHSLKEGKPVQGGGQGTQTEPAKKEGDNNEETPSWAKVLIESNKTLGEKLAALEGEKVTASRKQKLDAIIEKLPENLRKPYGRINLKDFSDEDFDTFITETTTEVEGIVSDLATQGSVITPPRKGNEKATSKKPDDKEVEAVVEGIGVI
jgi:hypothetical protein